MLNCLVFFKNIFNQIKKGWHFCQPFLLLQKQDKGYKITEKSLSIDLKPDFKGIDSEVDKVITRLKK